MPFIADVYEFNERAGLLEDGMDPFKELAYVFEESFEGFEECYNTQNHDGEPFKPGDKEYPTARQLGLSLANSIKDAVARRNLEMPSEVAEVDKSIDAMVFHVGKLAKMALTPDQITRMFSAVTNANLRKLDGPKDEHGKQLKPEGWTGPEDELQQILDERGINENS